MKKIIFAIISYSMLLPVEGLFAQSSSDNIIFEAMRTEMQREMAGLSLPEYTSPYFMSYILKEVELADVTARLGAIVTDTYAPRYRFVGGALYTGDYETNNDQRYIASYFFEPTTSDDDTAQISRDLWRLSDRLYKQAAKGFEDKKAALKRINAAENKLPDMITAEAVSLIDNSSNGLGADREKLRSMASELSEIFLRYPEMYDTEVKIVGIHHMTYMVNSEGSMFKQPITLYMLRANGTLEMADGTAETDGFMEFYSSQEEMVLNELSGKIHAFAERMYKLREAPAVDEYYLGPVLFEGASAMNILTGNLLTTAAILGQRKAAGTTASMFTFADRVGKKVIDTRLTVRNLTDMKEYKSKKLLGSYDIDIEGVIPTSPVTLIEDGIFRRTLNSRVPTEISSASTGSMRFGVSTGSIGVAPGVLHITAGRTESMEQLRDKMAQIARERGYEHAYIVRSEGFNAEIYCYEFETKELTRVRHAALSDVSIAKLNNIPGISDEEQIVNTQINAAIPVTIICPTALLIEEIEISPVQVNSTRLSYTTNPLTR